MKTKSKSLHTGITSKIDSYSNGKNEMKIDGLDIDSNTENELLQPTSFHEASRPTYRTYFRYEKDSKEKVGICLMCDKSKIIKKIKMKNGNTSGLKFHLNKNHKNEYLKLFSLPKNELKLQNQQILDTYMNNISNEATNWDKVISLWLAYKNLPLSFFDDETTQNFFKMLNKNVIMPKRNSMKDKVLCQFNQVQENLKQLLQNNSSKFSFSIDSWTARNCASYYGVTIHFIDTNWVYHSLALDFIPSNGNHTGKDIAQIFFNSIHFYEIQNKIQGITVDNASSNTVFIKELGLLMEKENIEFDTDDQHFRCFSHIMNLGVQDVLKLMNIVINENMTMEICSQNNEIDEYSDSEVNENVHSVFSNVVTKIRSTCKKIRNSEQLINRLKLFCELAKVNYVKVILDVRTRWDSTYDMLYTAYCLKAALQLMYDNCEELKNLKVYDVEWSSLHDLLKFLKYFKHISKILASESKVTLPTVVVACNMLIDKMESMTFQLDNIPNQTTNDKVLILAIQAGRDKILKHYKKCNWLYCVSLILDPRHKIEGFECTAWGRDLKLQSVQKFEQFYRTKYFSKDLQTFTKQENVEDKDSELEDDLILNSIYLKKRKTIDSWRDEIDNYYHAPRATDEIDILQWWKTHSEVYPQLAKMARDVLSILASSVPVERLFSEGSHLMTNQRTSLKSDTFKALICLNSWMKSSLKLKICNVEL